MYNYKLYRSALINYNTFITAWTRMLCRKYSFSITTVQEIYMTNRMFFDIINNRSSESLTRLLPAADRRIRKIHNIIFYTRSNVVAHV